MIKLIRLTCWIFVGSTLLVGALIFGYRVQPLREILFENKNALYLVDIPSRAVYPVTKPLEMITAAAWTADGTQVVVSAAEKWEHQLYVNRLGTHTPQTLDGEGETRLNYGSGTISYSYCSGYDPCKVLVVNARGQTISIGQGLDPSWSPDGTQLTFMGSTNSVYTRGINVSNQDGTLFRRITQGIDISPNWSPCEALIAYLNNPEGGGAWNLHVISPETGQDRLLTSGLSIEGYSWSPQGNEIAFVSRMKNNQEMLSVVNIETARLRDILGSPLEIKPDLAWSPLADQLAFIGSTPEGHDWLYLIDVNGTTLTPLIETTGKTIAWRPEQKDSANMVLPD